MTDQTAVDRIPIAHSVRYAARGLPNVPNQYGPGVLAPSEITLTYRAAPDSQLGRVHAYVAGRIWVDGTELPLLPGGLYGQHYDDGLDGWPAWLADEARLHDPAAERCICGHTEAQHFEDVCLACDCGDYLVPEAAREVIARWRKAALQARADRAAVLTAAERAMLTYALDQAQEKIWSEDGFTDEDQAAVTSLRRMADETRDSDTPAEDPARIDRIRPEFTEHSSVEAIDAQLQRARSQQRRWHLRAEWLISLRQRRVDQKARGEWPAASDAAAQQQPKEARP